MRAPHTKWTKEEDALLVQGMEEKLTYVLIRDRYLPARAASSIKDRAFKLRRTATGGALRYTARPGPIEGSRKLLAAMLAYYAKRAA